MVLGGEGSLPHVSDKIICKEIEEEMKEAYINYAMSVIVGRALPDVRDGLKPVHRRILYAMFETGMSYNKPFKKCAKIVGQVLGSYHPHGDSSVYDALVRMAQDFSLRYPLIKSQGNFGSIDGDSAAAYRYTEAKLNKLAEEMLKDIEKNTVNFKENFDGSLKEPVVLPSIFPNLLINGSSGIAVGMATNIPPHNINEICDATIATINNPEIETEELMKIVPGPDFPTGGEVLCGGALLHAYKKGRGKVIIKSVVEFEDKKIVVKEIPYMVNKAEMIEQIANLVKDKRIVGIRNINDESDREGIRIVIDLRNDVDPQVILNQLYQYSRMKVSFGINLLALVDNYPKLLGLKEMIHYHIEHRKDVIVRRTNYELDQAEKRVHILDGLLIALNNVDDVIAGIKKSATVDEAKIFLIDSYNLTEIQAKAILELRLQKLASLEQEKIRGEHKELLEKISYYKSVLESDQKVLDLIKEELEDIKNNYADKRKSKIVIGGEDDEDFDMEDLIEDELVVFTMTDSGYVKRQSLDVYKTQKRGGKGIKAAATKEEDVVESLYITSTHNFLLCFTNKGQLYWIKVWKIPEASRQSKGKHIANVLEMKEGERITAIVPVKDFTEGYLFMATKNGTVKKTELMDFSNPRKGGIRAINLDEGDDLIKVRYTDGDHEMILATMHGLANRFKEKDVRPMGRSSRGVRGIRLGAGDEVIGMLAAEEDKNILTITEKGYGKRTPVKDYRLCNRGGKGVTNIKITDKNGPVKTVMLAEGGEELMLVSKNGVGIRIKCSEISIIGRATQGVRIMRLSEGDSLAAAAKISVDDIEEISNEEEISENEGSNNSSEVNVEKVVDNKESDNGDNDDNDDSDDNSEDRDSDDNNEEENDSLENEQDEEDNNKGKKVDDVDSEESSE
ncbi:MAG: DNA gyrase subunit A [Candidatus Woesearchaeota archaeon]